MGTFLKILLALLIISTLAITITKPKMHSKVMIFDSDYIVDENDIDIEDTTIPVAEIKQEPIKETKVVEKVNVQIPASTTQTRTSAADTKVVVVPTKVQKVEVKPTTTQSKAQTVQKQTQQVSQQVNQQVAKKVEVKAAQTVTQTQKPQETVTVTTPKQVAAQTKTQAQTKVQTKSERELEIAWNKWRSDIQNQIMKDVRLPYIQEGTVFKFAFDVDKYGKITNVKTWSLTPSYTPIAIQHIAPVIRSYQGKSILIFPQGSDRSATHVEGGWKISDRAVYSRPQDYNDIERVTR